MEKLSCSWKELQLFTAFSNMITRFNLASKLERLELLPWVLLRVLERASQQVFNWSLVGWALQLLRVSRRCIRFHNLPCMHGMKYHFSILISNKVSQTSECFDERQRLYLRSKTTTENNNWAVSVYDEKRYFCKNTQTTFTCSVVTLVCFISASEEAISYHRLPDESSVKSLLWSSLLYSG